MLSIVAKDSVAVYYLIGLVLALIALIVVVVLTKDHMAQYFFGAVACGFVFTLCCIILNAVLVNDIISLSGKLQNNDIPYYTYGKYDGSYYDAFADYGRGSKIRYSDQKPVTLYDLDDGETAWNEVRKVETDRFEFMVFVEHLSKSTHSEQKNSTATPSYIDPRNNAQAKE